MVVRIDSWESTSLYPNGHSVRVLGRAGELETEIQTILIENCIHVPPFSDAQVRRALGGIASCRLGANGPAEFGHMTSCLSSPQLREMPVNSPERPWKMDPAQVAARRDLRESHLVFSIDPKGCEDVDDTLSVRSLAGGTVLELGVHIADVTYFVTEGSLTDLEARLRSGASVETQREELMVPPRRSFTHTSVFCPQGHDLLPGGPPVRHVARCPQRRPLLAAGRRRQVGKRTILT